MATSNIVTINEYRIVESVAQANLAFVTATVAAHGNKESLYDEVTASLNNQARPVKDSFRWLGNSKTHMAGFVMPNREVRALEGKETSGYRQVVEASNIYMDDKDKSLWEMKDGATGKYLARKGTDDLSHLIESARVSPRGSTPRMFSIQQAYTAKNQYVAYVNASRYGAEMDYGICLGHDDKDNSLILSSATRQVVPVPADCIVGSYEIETSKLPSLRGKVKAASATDAKLTPEEYWKLQYAYAPAYMEMVLKQVREMSAL